jgi:hypothetical protein
MRTCFHRMTALVGFCVVAVAASEWQPKVSSAVEAGDARRLMEKSERARERYTRLSQTAGDDSEYNRFNRFLGEAVVPTVGSEADIVYGFGECIDGQRTAYPYANTDQFKCGNATDIAPLRGLPCTKECGAGTFLGVKVRVLRHCRT